MPYLIDTNILKRLANASDAKYAVAEKAIFELHRRKEVVYITAQVLIEFRNAATRPKSLNGLGLTSAETERLANNFEAGFPLLPENAQIFPAWKSLVTALAVIGKRVHDARLVAICHVNSVSHILTFNTAHFTALAVHPPCVTVVDPASV